MTIRLFISYSHKDDAHRIQIAKHMAPLLREKDVASWFDGDIESGKAITPEIRKALRETDIFVALASHDYLASDYCYRKEYRPMLRKSKKGKPRVIVAIVGTCDWHHTEMGTYKALPKDGKSVDKHGNRNQAYLEIVQGIRTVVRAVRQEKGRAQAEIDRIAAEKTKVAKAKRDAAKKARASKAQIVEKPSNTAQAARTSVAASKRVVPEKARPLGPKTASTTPKTPRKPPTRRPNTKQKTL